MKKLIAIILTLGVIGGGMYLYNPWQRNSIEPPEEYLTQALGEDGDKQLLLVIRKAHDLLNDKVCYGRTPNRADVDAIRGLVPKIRELAEASECELLTHDLNHFIQLVNRGRPGIRQDWLLPHRIVHDLDYVLLGTSWRGRNQPIYYGVTKSAEQAR